MKRVGVLGDGAFGTAIATVLAHNGYEVLLWCHDSVCVTDIKAKRSNLRYLPNVLLSNAIKPTVFLEEVVLGTEVVFQAVPVAFLRSVLKKVHPFIHEGQYWVSLSKGIEERTLFFPTQLIAQVLGDGVTPLACSGPSFAYELAKQEPTGLDLAAQKMSDAQQIASLLANDYLVIRSNTDLVGVQIGGAIKNIIALGFGLLDGAHFLNNAKALFLTRAFAQMRQLGKAMGADPVTFDGLSGFGDLIMTCTGNRSRNRDVGFRLGEGESLNTILQDIGCVPEGLNTLRSVKALSEKYGLVLPLFDAIYGVIFEGQPVPLLCNSFLDRD